MKHTITTGALKKLLSLCKGERVTEGEVRPFIKHLKPLFDEKIIGFKSVSKTRKVLTLQSQDRLDVYLLKHYGIRNIEGYISVAEKTTLTRSEVLEASTDDKRMKVNPQTGLFVKANCSMVYFGEMVPFERMMNDGLAVHLDTPHQLKAPKPEVTIVGVENYETLARIKSQMVIFGKGLFLFVFVNASMLEWIEGVDNPYIHYGDFDYAGISIYKDKVLPRLKGKHSFFYPRFY